MKMYDRDGDGTIDWKEFQRAVWDGPSSSSSSRRGGGRWSDILNDELCRCIEDAKWTGESLREVRIVLFNFFWQHELT
jgi:hypothetical protein